MDAVNKAAEIDPEYRPFREDKGNWVSGLPGMNTAFKTVQPELHDRSG